MQGPFVVIMAGGRGERFWPASRVSRPKQLLAIVGGQAMLTQTLERLEGVVPPERVFILTNAEYVEQVKLLAPGVPAGNIVGEPAGRDTAAAVGLGALLVKAQDPQAVFAVLPADHVIHDTAGFQRVLRAAFAAAAREPVLVTIGVTPTHPATGYGYIHAGAVRGQAEKETLFGVEAFREKPNEATALEYLDEGNYFWNAGMFIWSVEAVEEGLRRHAPDLQEGLSRLEAAVAAGAGWTEALAAHYPHLRKISVDYALMEKADNVVMLRSRFDWDDVGEWPAVIRHETPDAAGNVVRGEGLVKQAENNLVVSTPDHLVAVLGVRDLVVVHTPDATLVCHRSMAQDLKSLVREVGSRHPQLL